MDEETNVEEKINFLMERLHFKYREQEGKFFLKRLKAAEVEELRRIAQESYIIRDSDRLYLKK